MNTLLAYPLMLGLLLAGTPLLAAAPAPPQAIPLGIQERADLSLLSAQNAWLLKQRAGELVMVEEEEGGPRWRRGYSYGLGSLVLTALIVTLVVLSQPDDRR